MTNPDGETTIVAETGLGKYQVEARMGDAAFLYRMRRLLAAGLVWPQPLQSERGAGRLHHR